MAALACSGSAQTADAPIDRIAELLPGLEVTLTDRDSESTDGLSVTDFGCQASDHDWPYGTGFAVLDEAFATPLWIFSEPLRADELQPTVDYLRRKLGDSPAAQ
ncbi:MAG: hypothetical protein ABFS34_05100 [Gemmatimonadota bacterium]